MTPTPPVPVTELRGWAWTCGIYGLCLVLHLAIDVAPERGYACDCPTRRVLLYRNNGFRVLAAALAVLAAGGAGGALPPASDLARCFWPACRAGCALGLALSAALYARGTARLRAGRIDRGMSCLTASSLDSASGADARPAAARDPAEFDARSAAEHFYCGLEWNPRPVWLGGADVKMFNYVVGAVGLAANVLSAVALHAEERERAGVSGGGGGGFAVSNAMLAYALPMLWFVCEYLWCEGVHVYTYDLFRERTGAKMCWGCWCFYPFFYCVGAWPLVGGGGGAGGGGGGGAASDISAAAALACVGLFACGWLLTRGANLQKHAWRTRPGAADGDGDDGDGKAVWVPLGALGPAIAQRTVPGSHGRLLCSGFWGLARHVNYLGEVTQGVALALPGWLATGSLAPWAYPAYYAALFVGRQLDDDAACAAKYGAAWDAYCAAVPYHIVPYVW